LGYSTDAISISDLLSRLNSLDDSNLIFDGETLNNVDDSSSNPIDGIMDEDDISYSDLINLLNEIIRNTTINNSSQNLDDNKIIINGTSDDVDDLSGDSDDGGETTSVGESADPLSGIIDSDSSSENPVSQDSASSSDSSSDASGESSNSPSVGAMDSSSSSSAHEISKKDSAKEINVEDNTLVISLIVICLFILLIFVGILRNKRDDD